MLHHGRADNVVRFHMYVILLTWLARAMYYSCFKLRLAATGGLLGLGFGFSILSAAELLYFFLLRWCYYWYQSKKKEQNLVHVQPSYPALIQTDFEGSVTKLPSQNRARVKVDNVFLRIRSCMFIIRAMLFFLFFRPIFEHGYPQV